MRGMLNSSVALVQGLFRTLCDLTSKSIQNILHYKLRFWGGPGCSYLSPDSSTAYICIWTVSNLTLFF